MTIPMTVDDLLAREGIRHRLAVYNNAGDRGQLDELAAVFTEDGILETPGHTSRGRAEIVQFLRAVMDRYAAAPERATGRARHFLSQPRIELTGAEAANVWTYFQVILLGDIRETGIYVDTFRKVGTQWLISHRRVKLEWMAPEKE